MYLSQKDIEEVERIKRLNIINSITGVKSANLIATISDNGITNVAIFSSVFHLGSNPALLGFIMRPAHNARRDTYNNIKSNGCFTVNNVHKDFFKNAHFTSAHFKENESEFKHCDLKEEFLVKFPAPFVAESNLKIALEIVEEIEIKSNKSVIIIGSVKHIFYPDIIESENGQLDLELLKSIGIGGLDTYYQLEKIGKLPFARVSDSKLSI